MTKRNGYAYGVSALLLLFALAASLLSGCGNPPVGTPAQTIKKAVEAQSRLKSVHVELDSDLELKLPGGNRSASVSYRGDYEQPDRWRLKVRSSGSSSEAIVIGDRVFVKLPGSDQWTEKTGSLTSQTTTPGDVVGSKYLKSARNVKLVDRKGDTYHLQFDLDMDSYVRSFNMGGVDPSAFRGKDAKMDVWVSKDSLRIERATMAFTSTTVSPGPGKLTMNMELQFSDFNEPVSIEPPI